MKIKFCVQLLGQSAVSLAHQLCQPTPSCVDVLPGQLVRAVIFGMKLGTGFVLVAVTHQHRAIILMSAGAEVLTRDQVMEGIPEMVHEIQVEATFPDGTKLVTVHNPIR